MIGQGISSGDKHGSHLKALFKLEVDATEIIQTSRQILRGKNIKMCKLKIGSHNPPKILIECIIKSLGCLVVHQRAATQHHLVEVKQLTSISSSIPPSSVCWDRRAAVCRAKVILSKENIHWLLIKLVK